MSNIPNDNQHNFIDFIGHHKPIPPEACKDLEQVLMDSLKPQEHHRNFNYKKLTKIFAQAIFSNYPLKLAVTSFLFTSFSLCFKTPRIAIEPKDLESFLVKNWHDTLHQSSYTTVEETEAYWLIPATINSNSSLSVSAQ